MAGAIRSNGAPSWRSQVAQVRRVVRENERGEQTLDLVEGSFEQSYRVGSTYTTKLFVDLCRSRGLLPYRHRRQHSGTICVRASLREHDALWSQFVTLSRQLQSRLHEVHARCRTTQPARSS